MTHLSIAFLTAAATALLLYRALLTVGIDHGAIFGFALTAAGVVFVLWTISVLSSPDRSAG